MLATVLSSAVMGIDAYIVRVEIDVADGLPACMRGIKKRGAGRGGRMVEVEVDAVGVPVDNYLFDEGADYPLLLLHGSLG